MSKTSEAKIKQMKKYQDEIRLERNNPEPKSYTFTMNVFKNLQVKD